MNGPKKKSRTLLRIGGGIFAVILVGLLLIPFLIKDHPITSSVNICINNLRNIDLAKNEWALVSHKATNDPSTWEDIKPYLKRDKPYYKFDPQNNLPICPSGGSYTIGRIGENPKCSVPGHSL